MLSMCVCAHSQNATTVTPITPPKKLEAADTIELNNLIKKGWELHKKNLTESAITNGLLAYEKASSIDFPIGILRSLDLLSQSYIAKADYANALTYELRYLKLAEEKKLVPKIAIALKVIAFIYQKEEHYFQSLSYYDQSYRKFLALADSENIAGVLTNMGLNYYQLVNQSKDKGVVYTDSALYLLNRSLGISRRNDYYKTTASDLGNLSEIYTAKGEYSQALDLSSEAIENYRKIDDINGEAVCYFDIGRIYFTQTNNPKAVENYLKALKIALDQKNTYLQYYCYVDLAMVSAKTNDYKSAFTYHTKMTNIRDSLINVEDLKQINEMQTKYETEKKEAMNKLLTEQNDLSVKTIKQQKTINYFIIAVLIMAVLFSILILRGLKKQRNANIIISKQKEEVEVKSSEIEKQKHLLEDKQKEILDSINYAKRIQDSLLENFDMVNKFFSDAFVLLKPKDIVSGDFYWLSKKIITTKIDSKQSMVEELLFIAICDSTGHGVPGGFMSLLNASYLSEAINEKNIHAPNKVFDHVRERLIHTISKNDQKDGFDGVLLCFNKKMTFENKELKSTTMELSYAAANNSPVIIKNGKLNDLEADKMPVGFGERTEKFKLFTCSLSPNDVIYAYTDGYADQFGGALGKKFKSRQLNDLLLSSHQLPLKQQEELLANTFTTWQGALEQVDDVCIIGIRV